MDTFKEHLFTLYAAACAPLASDSISNDVKDFDQSDFTVSTALEEVKFLHTFTNAGLSSFLEAFEPLLESSESNADSSPHVGLGLLAAAQYASRIAFVAQQVNTLCSRAADKFSGDSSGVAKDLEARVAQNERPPALRDCLDFTPHKKWEALDLPPKGRVGFKSVAAIYKEGGVEQEVVKEVMPARRKQRNPTAFHKFQFKGIDDAAAATDESTNRCAASTDEASTHASVGGWTGQADPLTSRSGSSAYSDENSRDKPGFFDSDSRSSSTVIFSFENERQIIEDKEADPQWEENPRHQKRYSRIRNRVPTGHPSLMKGPNEELAGLVNEYERTLSGITQALDESTVENTETNRNIAVVADLFVGAEEKPTGNDEKRRSVRMAP